MKFKKVNLNANKPPGPPNDSAQALKVGCNEIHQHLTYLINDFISYNLFPTRLKRGIFPNLKKDGPEITENYRPISITGALSKVFEKLLYKQIKENFLSNNLLSNTQFGFRTSFSTMNAIFCCTSAFVASEFFRKSLDENKYIVVSLLDLSKAFNSIKHEHLKNKLNELGFYESGIESIHSFINNRHQKTVLNNTKPNWISHHQGLPQGTILGLLIFNLYINDLNKNLTETCNVVQYEDDTILFCDDNNIKRLCSCCKNLVRICLCTLQNIL